MPLVVALAIFVVVSREGIALRQRFHEAVAMGVVLFVFLGIGAIINEHAVKPLLNSPRPNIAELSTRGLLPESPDAFYSLPDKAQRSEKLRRTLAEAESSLPMLPSVREHWINETGFSFPSGHSTAAMLVASFFFCMALAVTRGRRSLLLFALLPWALAVCYARPVLRVHRPIDITVGALQGILLGILSFVCVVFLLTPRPARPRPEDSP